MTLFDLFDEVDPAPSPPAFQHREIRVCWRSGWLQCDRPDLRQRCWFKTWADAFVALERELDRGLLLRVR
jgi:hypothetical protein